MIKNFKKIFLVLSIFVILFSTFAVANMGFVHAADGEYEPLSPIKGYTDVGSGVGTSLPIYLVGMFKLLIAVAGALAVVMIVIGGIQYMSTDAIYGKKDGKEKINRALGGLLLALASWLILNTINPKLLEISAVLPPSGVTQSSGAPTAAPQQPQQNYIKIVLKPLQGSYTEQTKCLGPYTSADQCNQMIGGVVADLFQSVYPPSQYQVIGTPACTASCVQSDILSPPHQIMLKIKPLQGPYSEQTICTAAYPSENQCNLMIDGVIESLIEDVYPPTQYTVLDQGCVQTCTPSNVPAGGGN